MVGFIGSFGVTVVAFALTLTYTLYKILNWLPVRLTCRFSNHNHNILRNSIVVSALGLVHRFILTHGGLAGFDPHGVESRPRHYQQVTNLTSQSGASGGIRTLMTSRPVDFKSTAYTWFRHTRVILYGAKGGTRTLTIFRSPDFESGAYYQFRHFGPVVTLSYFFTSYATNLHIIYGAIIFLIFAPCWKW